MSRDEKFYRPNHVLPKLNDDEEERIVHKVQEMHSQLNHASSSEMTQLITANPQAFPVTMKQHSKSKSSKPLTSQVPGKISAGNLMFVETRHDVKKPLLINVDFY